MLSPTCVEFAFECGKLVCGNEAVAVSFMFKLCQLRDYTTGLCFICFK